MYICKNIHVHIYIYNYVLCKIYVDPFGGLRNLMKGHIHVIYFQLFLKAISCARMFWGENKKCKRKHDLVVILPKAMGFF